MMKSSPLRPRFRQGLLTGLLALSLGCTGATAHEETLRPSQPSAQAAVAVPTASATASPVRPRGVPLGASKEPTVALGANGAVASQEANATDVGVQVLRRGGNAVDAAVAVGFALAVTHPSAGNLGGGGFMVVRTASSEALALDYREVAPEAAHRDMYLDASGQLTTASVVGPKAAGIPGTVAGLWAAHQRLGVVPWSELIEPAIVLAEAGFVLDAVTAADLAEVVPKMRGLGFSETAALFERNGAPLRAGDRLVQPDLAASLRDLRSGPDSFYRGALAKRLVRETSRHGGIWTEADLARYEPKWRTPIVFEYHGHQIISMPPPSSGGIVLQQLLMMNDLVGTAKESWRSAGEVHLFAETMRRGFADRNNVLADPDFSPLPLEQFVAPSYVASRSATIRADRATPSKEVSAGIPVLEKGLHTTHFSVVDSDGTAVSNTYTLNLAYGSKFAPSGTGILLNNEMDDFAVQPGKANAFGLVQGELNRIEPHKRMLSSMTPTIVVRDGEVRAILGSPGGPTIITTVAQLVRALIDYEVPLDVAVPAFRAHHQWFPDLIVTEDTMPEAIRKELERRGHKLEFRKRIGHANCIEVDPKTRGFRAVADTTRGGGKAGAY